MDTSADRAHFHFLSGYYCSHSKRLNIGGKIGGEEAASEGLIAVVDREKLNPTSVEFSDLVGTHIWRRVVPLQNATFSLYLRGGWI